MKKLFLILLVLIWVVSACKKDKLSGFEQMFEGNWTSVSYKFGSVEHSAEYHADLNFKPSHDFYLSYQWKAGSFSYITTYEQFGKWSGDEDSKKVIFDSFNGYWREFSATLVQGDSLRLIGLLDGNNAEIVFVRN